MLKFSAGGFRDFTRIAASDPTMWRDVFLHNKEAVLEMLGTFNEDLSKLTRAIRRGDGDALFDHFTRTRAIRRGIVEIGQDSAAPDFGRAARAAADGADPAALCVGRRLTPSVTWDSLPRRARNDASQNNAAVGPSLIGPSDATPSRKRSGILAALASL